MKLQNIECQLAQAQMSRYLAGEPLAEETLSQLERHLASCAECKQAALDKRSSLQTIIGSETPPAAAASAADFPSPDAPRAARPAKAVVGARIEVPTRAPDRTGPAEFLRKNARTLGLGLALGAVLIGMSFFEGDPTRMFGPKVKPTAKATTPPSPSEAVPPSDESKKPAHDSENPHRENAPRETPGSATTPPVKPEAHAPTDSSVKPDSGAAPAEAHGAKPTTEPTNGAHEPVDGHRSETPKPQAAESAHDGAGSADKAETPAAPAPRPSSQPNLPPPTGRASKPSVLVAHTGGAIQPRKARTAVKSTRRTAATPRRVTSRPRVRNNRTSARPSRPARSPLGTIRVYDESGRPLP